MTIVEQVQCELQGSTGISDIAYESNINNDEKSERSESSSFSLWQMMKSETHRNFTLERKSSTRPSLSRALKQEGMKDVLTASEAHAEIRHEERSRNFLERESSIQPRHLIEDVRHEEDIKNLPKVSDAHVESKDPIRGESSGIETGYLMTSATEQHTIEREELTSGGDLFNDLLKCQEWNTHSIVELMSHQSFLEFMDKISSIGMKEILKKRWDDQFDELVAYNKVHGDLFVPSSHPTLGSWVRLQCEQYKHFKDQSPTALTEVRFNRLKHIGFDTFMSWKEDENIKTLRKSILLVEGYTQEDV